MSLSKNPTQKEIEEYQQMNWCVAVVCLKETCEVLDDLITNRLKREIDCWPKELRDNLCRFSKRAYSDKKYIQFMKQTKAWEIVCRDEVYKTHTQIMEKIVSLSPHRNYKGMQWESNSEETTELYWILGKFYMPYGNSDSQGPGDTDCISKINLLKNCKLFSDDFNVQLLEQLELARQDIYHGNERLSSKEKETLISLMEQLLKTKCLKSSNTSDVQNMLQRLKSNSVQLIPVDLAKLEEFMKNVYPYSTRKDLLKMSQQAVDDCVNYALSNLQKASAKLQLQVKKEMNDHKFNKAVGGAVGAVVMAGQGVATGAAVGAIGSAVAGQIAASSVGIAVANMAAGTAVGTVGSLAVGALAVAPVAIPAVTVGAIFLGIGWIAGKQGGKIVSMFKKII